MNLQKGMLFLLTIVLLAGAALPLHAENAAQLFVNQQDGVQKKFLDLAEAFPADKFDWRPSPGVMSFREVLLHVAGANYTFPSFTGGQAPSEGDRKALAATQGKADVAAKLKASFDHARTVFARLSDADCEKKIKLFRGDSTVANMLMLAANHQHEHLGQLIAYARMNGIVPPWSK